MVAGCLWGVCGVNLLVLLTDAYGGRGGIARFNQDLLGALSTFPEVDSIRAFPRVKPIDATSIPSNVDYEVSAAGSKARYIRHLARHLMRSEHCDGVICGHLHLLPLAALAARRSRAPLILIIHGIEAWTSPAISMSRLSISSVTKFVSVSEFTKGRFREWAPLSEEQGVVIPDCVDLSLFNPGPKPKYLLERYDLSGKVILTLAHLRSSERYKGIDEVIDEMPAFLKEMPDLIYLIASDGDDRLRLEAKANSLGLGQHVKFTGYVAEHEKSDHYRIADAFVMPGRGEGFGIVYLEAMACGIPVVASTADASREAVLNGKLGLLASPDKPLEIRTAVKAALEREHIVQEGLEYFGNESFVSRWHSVLSDCLTGVSRFSPTFWIPSP